jgi:hypothetical protein
VREDGEGEDGIEDCHVLGNRQYSSSLHSVLKAQYLKNDLC